MATPSGASRATHTSPGVCVVSVRSAETPRGVDTADWQYVLSATDGAHHACDYLSLFETIVSPHMNVCHAALAIMASGRLR